MDALNLKLNAHPLSNFVRDAEELYREAGLSDKTKCELLREALKHDRRLMEFLALQDLEATSS